MTGVIYAGIGARKTPPDIVGRMRAGAETMAGFGFTLRSGGAVGADQAFEQGHDLGNPKSSHKEIYLPFPHFCKNDSPLCHVTKEARLVAKQYHPNWDVLGNTGRNFMGRNAYQILGQDLQTPCDFVLCWTPNGKITGGTGQALRHATALGIPILNFGNQSVDEISDFILQMKERHDHERSDS